VFRCGPNGSFWVGSRCQWVSVAQQPLWSRGVGEAGASSQSAVTGGDTFAGKWVGLMKSVAPVSAERGM